MIQMNKDLTCHLHFSSSLENQFGHFKVSIYCYSQLTMRPHTHLKAPPHHEPCLSAGLSSPVYKWTQTTFPQRSHVVPSFGYQICLERDDSDKEKPIRVMKFHITLQFHDFPVGLRIGMGL